MNILKPAMTKGYSKLLINEMIVADTGAHGLATAEDIILMVCMGSGERRVSQWRNLLASAGFRIMKIHTNPADPEGVIEAELE